MSATDASAIKPQRAEVHHLPNHGEAALRALHAAGFELIPLNRWDSRDAQGRERGKSPRDPQWRRRSYSLAECITWLRKAETTGGNVGVRLRQGEAVVDYDPRNAPEGSDPLADLALEYGLDPDACPAVETGGGGRHLYCKVPPGVKLRNTLGADFPGVEFKAAGRQVVAPGSIHPSGKRYTDAFLFTADPTDAPELPPALLEALTAPRESSRAAEEIPLADAIACLKQLAVEDYRSHDAWLEMMMAFHSATGGSPDGREAFIEWCISDDLYAGDAEDIRYRWDSLTPGGGVTVGTLYKHVADAGGAIPHASPEDDFADVSEEVAAAGDKDRPLPRTINLASVKRRDVEWLWHRRIPRRMGTLLEGDPKAGKTAVAIDLAARITRGEPLPFEDRERPPGRVLIIAPEDTLEEVIEPRFAAAGADMDRVEVYAEPWAVDQVDPLERLLANGGFDLVYVDAIMSVLGDMAAGASHRDSEVRNRLLPLYDMIRRSGAALLSTRHLRKGEAGKAIYAGGGSIAFGALARSELLCGVNPDAPHDERILAPVKLNVGREAPSLRYRIDEVPVKGLKEKQPLLRWLGESPLTANDVVAWDPQKESTRAKTEAATAWLQSWLSQQAEPVRAQDVYKAGKQAGHTRATLARIAKDAKSTWLERSGSGPSTRWALAATGALTPDDPLAP